MWRRIMPSRYVCGHKNTMKPCKQGFYFTTTAAVCGVLWLPWFVVVLLAQGHMHTQKMRQANREAAYATLDKK